MSYAHVWELCHTLTAFNVVRLFPCLGHVADSFSVLSFDGKNILKSSWITEHLILTEPSVSQALCRGLWYTV